VKGLPNRTKTGETRLEFQAKERGYNEPVILKNNVLFV
jgi:hypothetical protein